MDSRFVMKSQLRRVKIPKEVFVFCCFCLLECVVAGRHKPIADSKDLEQGDAAPVLRRKKPSDSYETPAREYYEKAWRYQDPTARYEIPAEINADPARRSKVIPFRRREPVWRHKEPNWYGEGPAWHAERTIWRGERPAWRDEDPAWRAKEPPRYREKPPPRGRKPPWRSEQPPWRGEESDGRIKNPAWREDAPTWRGKEPQWRPEQPEWRAENVEWRGYEPEWREEDSEWSEEDPEWRDEESEWREDEPEWREDEPEWSEEEPEWRDEEHEWREEEPESYNEEAAWNDEQSPLHDETSSSWGGAKLTAADRDITDDSTIHCVDGLVLPAWRPLEDVTMLERGVRGILYFLAMCYLFIGVSIASDRFMEAIEVITSSERRVSVINVHGQRETISVRVWNETVANLTLMALGSSAPEILLSIIEMFQKNFVAGELGPGTIVGSAAYNLFVIIAICIAIVPAGQVRRIRHFRVFIVTATWSLFAYIWLYLILAVISPNIVEVWEGLVTFVLFPLTVFHAYIAEKRMLCYNTTRPTYSANNRGLVVAKQTNVEEGEYDDDESKKEPQKARRSFKNLADSEGMREFEELRHEYLSILKELRQKYPQYELEKLEIIAQEQLIKKSPKSRAYYRIHATRRMVGSSDVMVRAHDQAEMSIGDVKERLSRGNPLDYDEDEVEVNEDAEVHIFFNPAHYTVMESVGDFPLFVMRSGDLSDETTVEYFTEDGTAESGSDYVEARGRIVFAPGIEEQQIRISIINDEEYEQEEYFYVHLNMPSGGAVLQTPKVATVMILDDDHCGIYGFEVKKTELSEDVGIFELKVKRYYGVRSKVIVPFRIEDGTATAGKEYLADSGQLTFLPGDTEQAIRIQIVHEHTVNKNVNFMVHLEEPFIAPEDSLADEMDIAKRTPSSRLQENQKMQLLAQPTLGEISSTELIITESEEFKHTVNKLVQTANASRLIGTSSWKEQFMNALTVSGGYNIIEDEDNDDYDDEAKEAEESEPGYLQYAMHFVTLFWKILFAVIPPSKMCNGYLSFFVSIILIAIATAVLADVATHFGCTLGVLDSVTAICFVAVGTSLPDTFASKVAAIHDKTADNCVGNVTGSNAVNVFLGIGIAWSMASIYHAFRGEQFDVPTGSLGFSTTLFLVEAAVAIALIVFRRKKSIGGELGGPIAIKWIHSTIIFSLWLIYIAVSTLEAYKIIKV